MVNAGRNDRKWGRIFVFVFQVLRINLVTGTNNYRISSLQGFFFFVNAFVDIEPCIDLFGCKPLFKQDIFFVSS
ncbi:hypothetical protein FQZ97_1099560 [compost metagenome]